MPVAKEFLPVSNFPKFIRVQPVAQLIPTLKEPLKTEALTILDQQYF